MVATPDVKTSHEPVAEGRPSGSPPGVSGLTRLMGLQAIYQAPRTTKPHPEHRLKGVALERPNQVGAAGITSIPVQRGFLYLVAIMAWATRRVLSWRLSNTLDARFCTEALAEALGRYGRPEVFNTDQGNQFTGLEFTSVLKDAGVAISIDGRGRCMDNIFSERPVALPQVRGRLLARDLGWLPSPAPDFSLVRLYDRGRLHSALQGSTPAEAYKKEMLTHRPARRLSSPASLPALPKQQDMLNRTLAA